MEKAGIVYGVSKLPWLQETILSALSAKRCMPNIPTELSIDRETFAKISLHLNLEAYFTYLNIIEENNHWRSPKFAAINSNRFQKVLYIDGDTLFVDRIDELFNFLDSYDIMGLQAIHRIHNDSIASGVLDIYPYTPSSFPEYNGGVLLFNNTEKVKKFKKLWFSLYEKGREEKNYTMDQASLRVSLYHSGLNIFSLSPEYNLRANVPNIVKDKVKIIHAHGNLPQIAQLVNAREGMIRIWTPKSNLIYGLKPKNVSMLSKTISEEEEDALIIREIIKTTKRMNR